MLDGVELTLELVANVWPIVDSESQLIQRFAARAYAIGADDSIISQTLTTLAKSDFALARQFVIPPRFKFVSEHGTLEGAVIAADFNQHQAAILEHAFKTLETDLPILHGVGVGPGNQPFHNRINISFPKDPYLVVTFLMEDSEGNLSVYSKL